MAICHGFTLFSDEGFETWELLNTDNKVLKKEVLEFDKAKHISKDPSESHSEDCILDENAPATKILLEEVSSILNEKGYNLVSSWGHVHPPNASTLMHDHGDAHVSWVYYINVPQGSGRITFYIGQGWQRPRKIQVEPRSGMMLIFPHWVLHEVERNRADDYRISVSGNAKLKEL